MGGHALHIGDMINAYRVQVEESDHFENLGCVQKMIVKNKRNSMHWINFYFIVKIAVV
jgi:hypothetical protein